MLGTILLSAYRNLLSIASTLIEAHRAYSALEGDTSDKSPWVSIQGRQAFLDALELYLAPVDDPELDERIAATAAVARTIPLTCLDRFYARAICAQFMHAIEADELVEEAREADRLAMQGWTNVEIAGEINMSRSSVALSISRILHKLRIRAVTRSLTSSTTDASARCSFVRSCPDRRAPREQETVRKLLVRCQVMAPDQQFAHSGERGGLERLGRLERSRSRSAQRREATARSASRRTPGSPRSTAPRSGRSRRSSRHQTWRSQASRASRSPS